MVNTKLVIPLIIIVAMSVMIAYTLSTIAIKKDRMIEANAEARDAIEDCYDLTHDYYGCKMNELDKFK